MLKIILIAFIVICIINPTFRCIVKNPRKVIVNGVKDLINYIKHKDWGLCPFGVIVGIIGLFGMGKTLTAVHIVVAMYRHYDGKMVWCKERKKFVTQRIKILSNVNIKVPHERLKSMEQVIRVADEQRKIDWENDILTVTLVIGDEFGAEMNNRNFKSNVDGELLNTILTSRHHKIAVYYTAQRFAHVDKIFRDVTSYVISCCKLWRLQRMNYYDGFDLENASNTLMIRPFKRGCWFVENKDYDLYNTYECVENLTKAYQKGERMTDDEILALRMYSHSDMDVVNNVSNRYKKRQKKRK